MEEKVVQFNSDNDKNVFGCIETFLKRVSQNSENTRVSYERAIREFFKTMRNKSIEDLVEKDLIFTKPQIERYQTNLRDKVKSTTVNNKISAIKKCYTKLEDYGFDVKASWFNVERYNEFDKESYDALTHQEVVDIINYISTTRKGIEKSLLIRMAYATAFRKQSLLDLKWSDLENIDGQWFIKTLGKGNKWDYKKISDELYKDLIEMKDNMKKDRENIFEITVKTLNRMMNQVRDNFDFGSRNIVFHSFKKSSIKEVALLTNYDLKAMQRQGNHSNISTTLNDYMSEKSMDELVVVDTNSKIDLSVFDSMSKEDLLNMIKSSDRTTQIKLLNTMKS